MKKLKEFVKANYKEIICVGITLICALFAFAFPYFLPRLGESLRDLGTSLAYWFCELFEIRHDVSPTVVNPSATPLKLPGFPKDYSEFSLRWREYWQLFVTSANVTSYMRAITDILLKLSKFLVLILPLVIALKLGFDRYMSNENNDYNKDSAALIAFKKFEYRVYLPAKEWLREFFAFIRKRKYYWITWIVLWVVYFNIASIAIEFFAFYFFFAAEFDFLTLFVQLYKLACDLSVPIEFVPGIIWLIAGYVVFHLIRKAVGYMVMENFESRNRGFIKERSISFMLCGSMGTKKTTLATDMALSQNIMHRNDALETLNKYSLRFPNFPWIELENAIKKAIKRHTVFNLATCRRFVAIKKLNFEKKQHRKNMFTYNYKRYGTTYNDDLRIIDIWEAIDTYTRAYFVYVYTGALVLSTYSIRFDIQFDDRGNFPLYVEDMFKREAQDMPLYSKRSIIADLDAFRLGKLLIPNNVNANVFEFGTLVLTEGGKERGNYVELKHKDKSDSETNQKNDLFNYWLKLCRHSSTIDYKPYVRVIIDDQRPASLGADARELCEIVHIVDASQSKLAFPFFFEGKIIEWLVARYEKFKLSYRHLRGDNTLLYYLFTNLVANLSAFRERITNRFGYCPVQLEVEAGTQEGDKLERKYYLMSKKIYSDRFSTACFEEFFQNKAMKSTIGLGDMPTFAGTTATLDEMKMENSYFINELTALGKR